MNTSRIRTIAMCAAACIGCSDSPTSPARPTTSPPIDRLFIFVRNWPTDYVELSLTRDAGGSTLVLFHPPGDGRPRTVIDSIGPGANEPEEVRTMLDSFDVWAMNAPNAPGAACRTVNGERSCAITWNDYSVVMRVESGGEVRVQRYTGLESDAGSPSVRALGDFVLAWVRRLKGEGLAHRELPAQPGAAALDVRYGNAQDLERAVRTNR